MSRKKQILITMLILTLSVCSLIGQAGTTQPLRPANWGQADAGTEANPYLIANLGNLRWMSEMSSEWWIDQHTRVHFRQTANINAAETEIWNDGQGFRPIGHDAHVGQAPFIRSNWFIGAYNGNNHIISNLCIRINAHIGMDDTIFAN